MADLDIKKVLKLLQGKFGGSVSSLDDIKKMGLKDERVQEILSDKDKLNEVLQNPEVQELIKKLKK